MLLYITSFIHSWYASLHFFTRISRFMCYVSHSWSKNDWQVIFNTTKNL